MNKDEAIRLAAAINCLRPDWSTNGLMTVLGDDRNRNRPVLDMALAFTALALDPKSRKPTRIYEHGPWWELLAPRVGSSITYKTISMSDCSICGLMNTQHPIAHDDKHEFEPLSAKGPGEKPTPEQRAAIDAAAAEAKAKITAAKEAAEVREVASVDDVLARHQGSNDHEELDMTERQAQDETTEGAA